MGARLCAAAAAVAITLAAAPAASAAAFSNLYVFGDSLVDAGNIYKLTGGAMPSTTVGYQNGRWTNGYDYTDLISQALFGSYTVASLNGGNNFAYGGARVVDTMDGIPDIAAQLASFKARIGSGTADANALYVLNFGGNDLFGADNGKIGTFANTTDYLNAAVAQYLAGITTLNGYGARNILVTGFPVLTSPEAVKTEQQFQDGIKLLSLASGTRLMEFDYLNFFTRLSANPQAFGFASLDLVNTCQAAKAYPACTGYFSFDGTHPVAAVQGAIFADMNRQFALTVPEPATWGMMVAGFAAAGVALRRRRRADAATA